MAIPASFASHWRRALETGDASGFTNDADMIAFFGATRVYDTLMAMSDTEKDHLIALRTSHPDQFSDAISKDHARRSEAAQAVIAKNRANLGGAPIAPKAPEKPKAKSWDEVIAKFNARGA
ncbi:hypothetical protein NKJ59_02660 [Mesorhizobium australicum]|uniref:hypothetical protein n=1 Tax=Mesorhizobium australicum TaxID=536018 RepID=UPI00333E10E9